MNVSQAQWYSWLADLILVIHFGFVAFVVVGFAVIWVGYFAGWRFVRNLWFRLAHLFAIGFVAAEAVAGMVCPLTTWEANLRWRAGEGSAYGGSFVQHWVHRVLFFNLPEWAFTIVYVVFFGFVFATFWIVKPERRAAPRNDTAR